MGESTNSIQCYMRGVGVSEKQACDLIISLIDGASPPPPPKKTQNKKKTKPRLMKPGRR